MKLKCEAEDMIDNSHLITMISMFVRYAEENENKHNQIPYSIENKEERHLDWFAKFLTITFLWLKFQLCFEFKKKQTSLTKNNL